MAEPRQLPHAPAAEAVIGIQVKYRAVPSKQALDQAKAALSTAYPIVEGLPNIKVRGPNIIVEQGEVGQRLLSADRLYVVQIRPARFSFSRLKPYEDWEPLFNASWEAWLKYRDTMKPEQVMRVSTRFINKLDLPFEGLDFDDYLTVGPRPPTGLESNPLSAFDVQTTLHNLGPDTRANIRLNMQGSARTPTHLPVILDIDVLRSCALGAEDDAAVQSAIRGLREVKNKIFFGSLTEKALRLFS